MTTGLQRPGFDDPPNEYSDLVRDFLVPALRLRGDIIGPYYRWSLDRATLTDNTQVHSDLVHTVTASLDGRLGISASDDSITVWRLNGPQPVLACRIKNCDARRLCVSRDVKIMFFAGDENTVKRTGIWSGTESTLFHMPDTTATALVCSENDDVLFVGCQDGSIFTWDIRQGVEIWRIADAHIEKISGLRLANNGKWLISAGDDFEMVRFISCGWKLKKALTIA